MSCSRRCSAPEILLAIGYPALGADALGEDLAWLVSRPPHCSARGPGHEGRSPRALTVTAVLRGDKRNAGVQQREGAGGTHKGRDTQTVLPTHLLTAVPAAQSPTLPPAAVMILPLVLLLLLATAFPTARGQAVSIDYTPVITARELEGKITSSTFVLEQPRCVFNDSVSNTDEIWLVVALSNAISTFTNPTSLQSLPAFQKFPGSPHYMTMGTSSLNYPCEKSSGQITVLRVGNETGCVSDTTRPDCNGPLPGPGPYRVKFLAMSPVTGPTAETLWSDPILLKAGKDPATIDTWPGKRSAGMIVITTILSILLAILLACFIAVLTYGCMDIAESTEIMGKQDPVTVKRYNTHHIYDQPALKH
ncbi:uroplakin-3b-like protein 1 [Pelodiscus sinensis]|uniref:uroplakin-3b-like protein 1 n=1 Tax=Pelodiscus sinensis TaxID=13735 RepID=UPI003F6D9F3A